jgi:2-polyprenyl-3-methyl-5-hydroxy-6-metoxy-1,4-benzoquinol methylase
MKKWLLLIATKIRFRLRKIRWQHTATEAIFTEIYNRRLWKNEETASGPGSAVVNTRQLIFFFPHLLHHFSIKSITDLACGDFNWQKELPLDNCDYLGYDIVNEIIKINRTLYTTPQIHFEKRNLLNGNFRKSDLLICRDVMVHLNYVQIQQLLLHTMSSGSKYLLATTFPFETNVDSVTGTWRPLNLEAKPFYLPKPLLLINETPFLGHHDYPQRFIGLWKLNHA